MTDARNSGPVLRVVAGGEPSDDELAALVVAMAAATSAATAPEPQRSAWASRRRLLRRPLHPGSDAWRRSARWAE